MNEVIKVNNVTKKYKNNRGIENVTLTMEQGEVHVLLGANGAGKSTLMRIIAGLLLPDSGEVLYCSPNVNYKSDAKYSLNVNCGSDAEHSQDMSRSKDASCSQGTSYSSVSNSSSNVSSGSNGCTADLKERLYAGGFMIEQPEPFGYMTAFDNLMQKGRYYAGGRDSAEEALRTVGLAGRQNEKVRSFSTGMKQRLGIAMALTGRPKYLILDEPSSGMDIEGRAELDQLLERLKNEGISILLSTHLVHEASEIADRITVIHDGKILRSCLKEEFLKEESSLQKWYLEQIHVPAGRSEARV